MRPSVQEILAAAQKALQEKVAPVVEDQWAASALRSMDAILNHLQARVPIEGPVLYEDNEDIVALLSSLNVDLAAADATLAEDLQRFLGAAATLKETAYPAVDSLSALNIQGREVIDNLLRLCIARQDESTFGDTHANIRTYLDRHIERERAFYFPTFVGRPV